MPYADLTDPQSLNLYGFVGGNPASKVDPDGHKCYKCKEYNEIQQNRRNGLGFRTNKQVKSTAKAFRDSFQKDDKLIQYNRDTGETTTITKDQLDQMSDAQIVKLSDQIAAESPATQEDLDKVSQIIGAAASAIPSHATNTLSHIDKTGSAPAGQQGGATFENRESRLPKADANGKSDYL